MLLCVSVTHNFLHLVKWAKPDLGTILTIYLLRSKTVTLISKVRGLVFTQKAVMSINFRRPHAQATRKRIFIDFFGFNSFNCVLIVYMEYCVDCIAMCRLDNRLSVIERKVKANQCNVHEILRKMFLYNPAPPPKYVNV